MTQPNPLPVAQPVPATPAPVVQPAIKKPAVAPVATKPNPAGTGRPVITEAQYQKWLDEMYTFLRQGCSLWHAIDKCALLKHRDSIYEKYRLNDWFSEKIDAYRATPGEMVNSIGFKIIERIHTRLIASDGAVATINKEEIQIWQTMAKFHRTSQPFFVNRQENAEVDDSKVGKVLDVLEESNYEEIGSKAKGQVVAPKQPVHNQGQARPATNVQAKPNPVQAPSS